MKLTLRESARLALQEVIVFWEKARISTSEIRKSEAHKKKEANFKSMLEDLFDIAHATALENITIEEDKQFLMNQRLKGRQGFMFGVNFKEIIRERKVAEREETALIRKKRSNIEIEQLSE